MKTINFGSKLQIKFKKMEFVKLKKFSYGYYFYYSTSSIEMDILGDFLSNDFIQKDDFFLNWIIDDNHKHAASDATILTKEVLLFI